MSNGDFSAKVKRHVADNFDQSCRLYQDFENKHHFFADLTLRLAETIGVREDAHVLDVGCGNGISAQVLNRRYGCKVLGVDLSPGMVAAGRAAIHTPDVELMVGDGECLADLVQARRFDYVLYNMALFIFPDAARTLGQAYECLHTGGKIAFSYYPLLLGADQEDLLPVAFSRLGQPAPRFRVITDYPQACRALANLCGELIEHRWAWPLDLPFLVDFFSIPAQSASLFPGRDVVERRRLVAELFGTLKDATTSGATIVWRMAEGVKPREEH